jgi:hypothetical protein
MLAIAEHKRRRQQQQRSRVSSDPPVHGPSSRTADRPAQVKKKKERPFFRLNTLQHNWIFLFPYHHSQQAPA